MKKLTLSLLGSMVLVAIMGSTSASAGCHDVYRNYYIDGSCRYYYNDMGKRQMEGYYSNSELVGLSLQRDANGRVFHQDSFGNRIYMVKRCG